MPDMGGEVIATRVAFLELKDERRLVQEGYELLDEKRVLLATEMLRQLRHYLALQDDLGGLVGTRTNGVLDEVAKRRLVFLTDGLLQRDRRLSRTADVLDVGDGDLGGLR